MTDSLLASTLASETLCETGNPQTVHLPPLGSAPVTAETLRHFRIFADLDDAQRERLVSQMHPLTVPARTILLAAGQPGHAVYFLLEGTVKIGLERPTGPRTQKAFSLGKKEPKEAVAPATVAQATGAQVMLNLCGPGSVLGELSVLDGRGHSASVTARETCRLLWIDKDAFLEAMEEMPGLPYALLRECSDRLRNATHQLHAFATLDATGRIASALLRLAERFGVETPKDGHPAPEEGVPAPQRVRLEIGLTQPELAELVGLTRVRVNTIMSAFKDRGWLTHEPDGTVVLHDMASLAALAHITLS